MNNLKKFQEQLKMPPDEGETLTFSDEIRDKIKVASWDYVSKVYWFNPSDKSELQNWIKSSNNDFLLASELDKLEDVLKVIKEEKEVEKKKLTKEYIENLKKDFKNRIIDDFAKNDFLDKENKPVDKKKLKEKIHYYLNKTEDLYDVGEIQYAFDSALRSIILKTETENIDEIEKDNSSKIMKIGSYLWVVAVNIFQVIVLLAIYDTASYDNDKIIIYSLLVLIYLSVQAYNMALGQFLLKIIPPLNREFIKIRDLLNDKPSNLEIKELEIYEKTLDKASAKTLINTVFIFILYVIAIFNLLGVVFG